MIMKRYFSLLIVMLSLWAALLSHIVIQAEQHLKQYDAQFAKLYHCKVSDRC